MCLSIASARDIYQFHRVHRRPYIRWGLFTPSGSIRRAHWRLRSAVRASATGPETYVSQLLRPFQLGRHVRPDKRRTAPIGLRHVYPDARPSIHEQQRICVAIAERRLEASQYRDSDSATRRCASLAAAEARSRDVLSEVEPVCAAILDTPCACAPRTRQLVVSDSVPISQL